MGITEERRLVLRMIEDTKREIKKKTRDRIYLEAELEELYNDLSVIKVKSRVKVKLR